MSTNRQNLTIRDLAEGLNISEEIIEKINHNHLSREGIYELVPKLLDNINLDTYKFAGRVYLYSKLFNTTNKIEEYVQELDKFLNDYSKEFMLKHKDIINSVLERDNFKNYSRYDFLSASAVIQYLLKSSPSSHCNETPCQMFLRQAIQMYHNEGIDEVLKCYDELINEDYVHASPTMYNSCLKKNQLSSCFLMDAGDSIESLQHTVSMIAMISKLNGASGVCISNIRHSGISNTGVSGGIIPFAKQNDASANAVNQGGMRSGAVNQQLEIYHKDILVFNSLNNLNRNAQGLEVSKLTVLYNYLFFDRFSKAKENVDDWTLFCPAKAFFYLYEGKILDMEEEEKYFLVSEKIRLFDLKGHLFDKFYPLFEKEAEKREEIFQSKLKQVKDLEILALSDREYKDKYCSELKFLEKLRKRRFEHTKTNTIKIMQSIISNQVEGSNPFMVNIDAGNTKNNMKRIGKPIRCTNLCLEIYEYCEERKIGKGGEIEEEGEIASCNLANINLKKFCRGKLSQNSTKEEICDAYDFDGLGKVAKKLVKNINKVIDFNFYISDQFRVPNMNNRPLGIGVSGFGDCLYLMEIYYDSPSTSLFNKMVFACIYYNCLVASNELSIKDGPYPNFNKGQHYSYVKEEVDFHGRDYGEWNWKVMNGSPASVGDLQFDMWIQENQYHSDIGRDKLKNFDIINPYDFGVNDTWNALKRRIKDKGLRNSMLIALMPTATSAQLLNNTEITEIHKSNLYMRRLSHGQYYVINPHLIRELGDLYNTDFFKYLDSEQGSVQNIDIYFQIKGIDIDSKRVEHIKKLFIGMEETKSKVWANLSADRGIYICQGESHNVYIGEPDERKISMYHRYANNIGLKTGMYYMFQKNVVDRTPLTVTTETLELKKQICSRKNPGSCTSCE